MFGGTGTSYLSTGSKNEFEFMNLQYTALLFKSFIKFKIMYFLEKKNYLKLFLVHYKFISIDY